MKWNMKRLAMGLTMAICLFSFSISSDAAPGALAGAKAKQVLEPAKEEASAPISDSVDPMVQSQLQQLPSMFVQMFVELEEQGVEQLKAQAKQAKTIADAATTWQSLRPELGNLVSIGDNVVITKTSEGYRAAVDVVFEHDSLVFTMEVDDSLTAITSVSFGDEAVSKNPEDRYGWIFVGAIVLVLAILGMRKFNSESGEASSEDANTPAHVPAPSSEAVNLVDDLELVAVMTAAIAASTGSSPDHLVVRSIRRTPSNNWKNA